jgi:hypothetical protein
VSPRAGLYVLGKKILCYLLAFEPVPIQLLVLVTILATGGWRQRKTTTDFRITEIHMIGYLPYKRV